MTKKNPPRRRADLERPTRSGKELDRLLTRPIRSGKQIDRLLPLLKAEVKARRMSKTRARAMRQVAELIREVVALEKRVGFSSSVFSLKRLPKARPRRAGGAKRRRPKG
jgi:hypothetical protein